MSTVIPSIESCVTYIPTSKSLPAISSTVSHQRAPTDPGNSSFTFTVTDKEQTVITGYEWRLYKDEHVSGTLGTLELDGEEVAVADNQEYKYYTASTLDIALQIMHPDYEEFVVRLTLTGEPVDLLIILVKEEDF